MKVAIAQYKPVFLNIKKSTEKAVDIIKEASSNGAALIAFPETWLPGYPVWLDYAPKSGFWNYPPVKQLHAVLINNSFYVNSNEFKIFQEISNNYNIIIVIGVNELEGKTLYNSIFTFLPGNVYLCHRKLVPTYTEKLIWGVGNGSGIDTIKTEFGNVGSLICWEHWMPLLKAAMYSKNEMVHIAQWTSVNDLHLLASRHYAFEAKCFVLAVGCVLQKYDVINGFRSLEINNKDIEKFLDSIDVDSDYYLQNGGSCMIGPDSNLITKQFFEQEKTILVEINRDLIYENVLTHDSNGHYSRPDLFELKVKI